MVIKYAISPYTNLLEDMVVKVYEAQSPDAEVYTQTIPAPHDVPVTVTINGMDLVPHIVRLYAADSLVLLHEYNVEPTNDVATLFDPIFFKIGDGGALTPAANTANYVNPLLLGLEDAEFTVFRNTYGYLFPNYHYDNDRVRGGFALKGSDTFNDQEEFYIQRKPSFLKDIVNDSVVGKWFGGFFDITGDVQYAPTHLRKLLRLIGDCSFEFPAEGKIPIGYGFVFTTFGAPGQAYVYFSNAPLLYGGSTRSGILIPPMSEAMFVYDGASWNLTYLSTSTVDATSAIKNGSTLGCGIYHIGDVPPGDPTYEVVHNKNVQGDYGVMLSIQSNSASTYYQNNKVGSTWYWSPTNKANSFFFSLQEISGELQDLSVFWQIIKL